MNTNNNKRSQKTDEEIVKAAFAVMLEENKPISKITVREICERAKINRSTFYTHYMDVYDLFEKVEAQMAKRATEAMYENLNKGIFVILEEMFTFIKSYKRFYLLYFTELSKAARLVNSLTVRFQEGIEELKSSGENTGIQGEMEYHYDYFTAGICAIISRWLIHDCRESPRELCEIIKREYMSKGSSVIGILGDSYKGLKEKEQHN